MPQLRHDPSPLSTLSEGSCLVLAVLLAEVNLLREALDLPPRTPPDMRDQLRLAIKDLHAVRRHQQGDT